MIGYSFLIVDDDQAMRDYLADIVVGFYPEARIAGCVGNSADARKVLLEEKVDVMLLDINLPGESGMELLQSLKNKGSLKTIFVTGHIDYTLSAIKHSVFDYLLKPVDQLEFQDTMERLIRTLDQESLPLGAEQAYMDQKLALHHSKGFRFIRLGDIVYLQASSNYTHIQLINGDVIVASRPLKEFQARLDPSWFLRVHKSYIINVSHIDQYLSEDGGRVMMKNGEKIYMSRYKIADFFNRISAFTKGLKA
jgi:two-component system LytT family response regulator